MNQSTKKLVITGVTLAVIILLAGREISLANMGHMADCPLMGNMSSMCEMNILNHMALVKLLFATLPHLAVVSVLFVAFLFTWTFREYFFNTLQFQKQKFRQKLRENFLLKLYNYLLELFAQGILHPKVYQYVRG